MSKHASIGRHRAAKPPSNYVGRVGALAVALGVGLAISSSTATAWAGPDGSSAGGATPGESTPSPTDTGKTRAAHIPSLLRSPSERATARATRREAPVRGLTTSRQTDAPEPDAKLRWHLGSHPLLARTPASTITTATKPKTLKTMSAPALAFIANTLTSSTHSARPIADPSTTQFAGLDVAAAAPTTSPDFLRRVATGVVGAVFHPLGTGSPQAPALPAQTMFGFLDALRREFERFLSGSQSPTLTYDAAQTTQVGDVFTGTVVVSDFDGKTPAFTATAPANGVVLITPDENDPNMAHFTYIAGGDYTGSDSFDITVTDANAPPPTIVTTIVHLLSFGLLGGTPSATRSVDVIGVAGQDGLPPGFERTVVVSGLDQPTDVRFLPDGRIMISEKGGAIRVFDADGAEQSSPVMTVPVSTDWARGLLGIEVDPDFEDNGYIYAAYITSDNHDQLSRFTVTDPTAAVLTVDPASELVLMHGDQPAADDHHGGTVRFGPDGKLYWSTGDNGWNQNAPGVISQDSQDLSNIYGKIMRLNPDGSIPDDNPFLETPGAVPQIYAYGFRNPYRFTFAPDGTMLVGDVGESTWEELDNVVEGGNYGWPKAEGPCSGVGTTSCSKPSPYANPIYYYAHDGESSAITGEVVPDATAYGAQYQNTLFIADFKHGVVKALTFDADYTSLSSERTFDANAGPVVSMVQGPDGDVYELTISGGPNDTGTLTRISRSTG